MLEVRQLGPFNPPAAGTGICLELAAGRSMLFAFEFDDGTSAVAPHCRLFEWVPSTLALGSPRLVGAWAS